MARERTTRTRNDTLVGLVQSATRAPSSHNTQPCRFKVGTHEIQVLADPSRQLPIADPDGRELLISCGAALFNLTVAAHTPACSRPETASPRAQGATSSQPSPSSQPECRPTTSTRRSRSVTLREGKCSRRRSITTSAGTTPGSSSSTEHGSRGEAA